MNRDMKRQWAIEELIERFTLVDEDKNVLENKTGATLLGCTPWLKYFEYEACFPSAKYEIPKAVVDYVARQFNMDAKANSFIFYGRSGDCATDCSDEQEWAALCSHSICCKFASSM